MADSNITGELRDSRTLRIRIESIAQEEAYLNTLRQIDYNRASMTRECLTNMPGAVTRLINFVAADNQVVAEYTSGKASEMPDPVDNVTEATLLGAVAAVWVAASEGL